MMAGRERGWRAFFAALTEAQRRDVREILAEDYAAEIRMARQLAEHANRLGRYPDRRARLLEIAAREEEHARWLREAIEQLGGRPPERVGASPSDARTNWERLVTDLETEKGAFEKFLRDAYTVERDHPEIARLLLRIGEEEAAHRREIANILARSDRVVLDRPSLDVLTRRALAVAAYTFWSLRALEQHLGTGALSRLPFSIRVLFEGLLRRVDGWSVSEDDVEALARWSPFEISRREIAFRPARVLLQDFEGVAGPAGPKAAARTDPTPRQ